MVRWGNVNYFSSWWIVGNIIIAFIHILDFNKNLPKKGEMIKFDNYLIKILSMNDNRIDSVFFKENV